MKNIIITLVLLSNICFAYKPTDDFTKGNKAYSSKNYTEALSHYKKIINEKYSSAELFFNIANSYFKIDSIPSAILYYERAKKLSPADEDINFNLNAAYKRIADKQEHLPELFYQQWFTGIANALTLKGWAIASITLISIACLLLVLYFFTHSRSLKMFAFFTALVFLIGSGISYALGSYQEKKATENSSAIIFKPSINAKSEPSGSTDLFILHEGTKVLVIDKVEDFYKIKIANGQVGWLPLSAIRII
jgi:tetratricopeptide (TPR) repeat protein